MSGLQLLLACLLLLVEHIFGHARYRFRKYDYRSRENDYRSRDKEYRSRENEFQPNSIEHQECPMYFRCIVEKWCRPEALESIRGEPQTCGYSNDWKIRICCPLRTHRQPRIGIPTPWTPYGENVTPSISGRNVNKECGKSKAKPARRGYVVGGIHAKQGAWPWMVAIIKKDIGALICTGFLIDRQHVLTAAHCFEDGWKRKQYSVKFGHIDLTKSKEYNIKRIKIHPGFKSIFFYDDIALLTLTRPVQTHNFNPICLPWSREFIDMTDKGTSIAGWGSTTPGGKTSATLMELTAIPVVSNQQCNQAFSMRVMNFHTDFPNGITNKLICAGFVKGKKDSCQGDSGGPLMFENKGQWYAIGIVAFGSSCGRPGVPGGYTKVSEYLDWINENRNDV